MGTLVERTSRYVVLLHLPGGRDAAGLERALRGAVGALPAALRRSLTWDQGKEIACHAAFTACTGVRVFFCDPHKPWQRGSNENTNGLLRQYVPKGMDLSVHSADDLARYARSPNNRPARRSGMWLHRSDSLSFSRRPLERAPSTIKRSCAYQRF